MSYGLVSKPIECQHYLIIINLIQPFYFIPSYQHPFNLWHYIPPKSCLQLWQYIILWSILLIPSQLTLWYIIFLILWLYIYVFWLGCYLPLLFSKCFMNHNKNPYLPIPTNKIIVHCLWGIWFLIRILQPLILAKGIHEIILMKARQKWVKN